MGLFLKLCAFFMSKSKMAAVQHKIKAQNDQFTVNQLKMLFALLFEVIKNNTSKL